MSHFATPNGAIPPATAELAATIDHEPSRLRAVAPRPFGSPAMPGRRVVVLLVSLALNSEAIAES